MKGKELEFRVKGLLAEPEYRKSDVALMCRIWYEDILKIKYAPSLDNISATEVLQLIKDQSLTSWDSVTRCRRKLQEKFPELRDAEVWEKRHGRAKEMKATKVYY